MTRTALDIIERVRIQLSIDGGEPFRIWTEYGPEGRMKLVVRAMRQHDVDTELGCCQAVAEIVSLCQPKEQKEEEPGTCSTNACGMKAVDTMDGHAFCTTCLEAYAHGVMHQREKDLEEIDALRGRLPMPREYGAAPKMLGVLEALRDNAHHYGIGHKSHAYAMIVDAIKEAKPK
jgi:hypothetical protein